MLSAIIFWYNKRKYRKKLQQLTLQESIQRERYRISRDLHDNVGAYTTALAAGAEELTLLATKKDIKQTAENISANAKNIIASLQETIWVLNNETITITDFSDRLKVYTRKILHHNKSIQIRFHENIANDLELSPGEALNIFRVMQEALHNVQKHSDASLVNIEITSNSDGTMLSIKDNGNGFDLSGPKPGNGIYNMHHRCQEAGYELSLNSCDDGTIVSIKKNHSFAV